MFFGGCSGGLKEMKLSPICLKWGCLRTLNCHSLSTSIGSSSPGEVATQWLQVVQSLTSLVMEVWDREIERYSLRFLYSFLGGIR